MTKKVKKVAGLIIKNRKVIINDNIVTSAGIGKPSVFHALVVIYLEFFAWGLLTMPVMSNLIRLFPNHIFLMNGIIMGIKGLLSFLSAPLIGALSDVWGRKCFLLITVFFTCLPIPLLAINTWWCFALTSISGVFAVTFSVVFAYVADITKEEERSAAYGIVSATFAASFVISPALGAYLLENYSENFVVALATAVAVFDVLFILVAVPESLPEKLTPNYYKTRFTWEQADPFALLKKVGIHQTVLLICITVLFSFIPEAGVYSCIFVYIRYVIGFSMKTVVIYIATLGMLAVFFQSMIGILMGILGPKRTVLLGLFCEAIHLLWFSFSTYDWMVWMAGFLASFSTITYPAISSYVSVHSDVDKQGLIQGIVMGVRSLCNGIGPALFGLVFYLSGVDLYYNEALPSEKDILSNKTSRDPNQLDSSIIRGPPFLLGTFLTLCALILASFIPENNSKFSTTSNPG
ncbi:hypothetical protein PGB90_009392 [Kerria lacca]